MAGELETTVSGISQSGVRAAPPPSTATGKCCTGTPLAAGVKMVSPNAQSLGRRPVLVAVMVSVTDEGRLASITPGEGRCSASSVNWLGLTDSVKPGSLTTLTV